MEREHSGAAPGEPAGRHAGNLPLARPPVFSCRQFGCRAGSWPNTLGNANIVPVVANGKVFVAANKSLRIFGVSTRRTPVPGGSPIASLDSRHVISGTLLAVDGTTLTLQTRNGKSVKIDDSQAAKNEQIGTPLDVGIPLTVRIIVQCHRPAGDMDCPGEGFFRRIMAATYLLKILRTVPANDRVRLRRTWPFRRWETGPVMPVKM
jgi:hypothetical protein